MRISKSSPKRLERNLNQIDRWLNNQLIAVAKNLQARILTQWKKDISNINEERAIYFRLKLQPFTFQIYNRLLVITIWPGTSIRIYISDTGYLIDTIKIFVFIQHRHELLRWTKLFLEQIFWGEIIVCVIRRNTASTLNFSVTMIVTSSFWTVPYKGWTRGMVFRNLTTAIDTGIDSPGRQIWQHDLIVGNQTL